MLKKLHQTIFPNLCPVCREASTDAVAEICDSCFEACLPLEQPQCTLCAAPYDGFLNCCQDCLVQTPPWDAAVSSFHYTGAIRQGVHLFKYHQRTELLPFIVKVLATAQFDDVDVVCPVPMHWLKEFWRGYNQVDLLATTLAKTMGIPSKKLLKRRKWTRAQVRLNRKERLKNIVDVFRAVNKENIKGRSILLLDDVMTTGATLSACSQVLKTAGAKKIFILTLARG